MVTRILVIQNDTNSVSQVFQRKIQLKKLNKGLAVFAFNRPTKNLVCALVVATNQMIGSLADCESPNGFLLTTLHPTSS